MSSSIVKKTCGAKTQKGHPCQSPPLVGGAGGRCRRHGGLSHKGGPTHHRWKHGRTSKVYQQLPKYLRGAFEATITDPKAFSLLNEVAVLDARQLELLGRIDLNESREAWKLLKELASSMVSELDSAVAPEDLELDDLKRRARRLHEIASRGVGNDRVWSELYDLVTVRGKLVDAETRRLREDRNALDSAQVVALIGWIVQTLQETVTDRDTLLKFLFAIEQKIGPLPEGRRIEASSH